MLNNPRVGQRVRVAEEYRDEWPVQDLAHIDGEIAGIGNWPMVRFRNTTVHVPAKFLELIGT
jgi:hypothetical protein